MLLLCLRKLLLSVSVWSVVTAGGMFSRVLIGLLVCLSTKLGPAYSKSCWWMFVTFFGWGELHGLETARRFPVFNVRQSYCARYMAICWTSVLRPSVHLSFCLSVTRWCVETAQPIVKLSSLPGSPMILVFWGLTFFPEFQWEHPNGSVKCKGVGKSCNFWPISRYSS